MPKKNATSFKPGQSGNPRGRKPGQYSKVAALRDLLTPHSKDLIAKAVEMAKGGDTTALRLCLERLVPPVKSRDEPVIVEGLSAPATLVEQGQAVIDALAAGKVGPGEAASLMQTVASQARIVEVDELERRVAALERDDT